MAIIKHVVAATATLNLEGSTEFEKFRAWATKVVTNFSHIQVQQIYVLSLVYRQRQ